MNHDDWGLILPPLEQREMVQIISSSGMPITDVLLKGFTPASNHPSGGFFEPRTTGSNYRRLLEEHPLYIDPVSSLADGYLVNFMSRSAVADGSCRPQTAPAPDDSLQHCICTDDIEASVMLASK